MIIYNFILTFDKQKLNVVILIIPKIKTRFAPGSSAKNQLTTQSDNFLHLIQHYQIQRRKGKTFFLNHKKIINN